jgi:flagellar biosynthesis/type III secretory pathway M-ring protein FliF/YscJ
LGRRQSVTLSDTPKEEEEEEGEGPERGRSPWRGWWWWAAGNVVVVVVVVVVVATVLSVQKGECAS